MLIHPNSHAAQKLRRRKAVRFSSTSAVALSFPSAGMTALDRALITIFKSPRIIT